jgi:hypothetical protein
MTQAKDAALLAPLMLGLASVAGGVGAARPAFRAGLCFGRCAG